MASASSDLSARLHVRQPLSKSESGLLSYMAENGKSIFTLDDVTKLNIPYEKAKLIVSRLMGKGWLISLSRGKYLIAPLEAGVGGRYSEHEFIIASHLNEPYYIGYWSALQYHGLTEQVPMTVYVVTTKHILDRDRVILESRYKFVTVIPKKFFGFSKVFIANSLVNVSDKAKTIVDCLDHPEYCGGITEVAKALGNERDSVSTNDVVNYGFQMQNSAVLKRFGYLAELLELNISSDLLDELHQNIRKGYSLLDPVGVRVGKHSTKWGLVVNVSKESLLEWRKGY